MESSSLQRAIEIRQHVTGEIPRGELDRPSHEVMEVNRGLHCRPQDAGDARPIGYLPRRGDYREWNPLREVSV